MIRCPHCGRHHLADEERCPFCSHRGGLGRAARRVAAVASTLVLMACYGPATLGPIDTGDSALVDADADGYTTAEDCDDTDPAVNPDATEDCDDTIDNDCDGLIDTKDAYDCPTG